MLWTTVYENFSKSMFYEQSEWQNYFSISSWSMGSSNSLNKLIKAIKKGSFQAFL